MKAIRLSRNSKPCEAMPSSCGDSEGCARDTACPSQAQTVGCTDLLHELSNLVTGVLVNAQVLGWKLPPYSHLKRPVREVERNAQRVSELLKRLSRRCAESSCDDSRTSEAGKLTEGGLLVTATAPPVHGEAEITTAAYSAGPGQFWCAAQSSGDLTEACDRCTSGIFPKRDDSAGRHKIGR